MTDTITKAAQTLVAAIKIDRHDWEDWPSDSRKAFDALKAALAAPQPAPIAQSEPQPELLKFLRDSYQTGTYATMRHALGTAISALESSATVKVEPQPVKQADQSCRNCTFHYKDVDMPPCSSCTLGDHVGNNWEPMNDGQLRLAEIRKATQ